MPIQILYFKEFELDFQFSNVKISIEAIEI